MTFQSDKLHSEVEKQKWKCDLFHKYYTYTHENWDTNNFYFAKQLYLSTKGRFHLTKVVKLRSNVETWKNKKFEN
jgi:hypothetical protein